MPFNVWDDEDVQQTAEESLYEIYSLARQRQGDVDGYWKAMGKIRDAAERPLKMIDPTWED